MKSLIKLTIVALLITSCAFIHHVQQSKEVQTAFDPGGGRK